MWIENAQTDVRLTRRGLLARGSNGFGLLALCGLMNAWKNPLIAKEPPPKISPSRKNPPKVKSVIFCFMSGGVSQVDSFDPKPRLKRDHGKPMPVPVKPTMFNANGNIMASPWNFTNRGQSGIPVSELFPHIGGCADDLAVIRSMTSIANEHAQGNYFLHTGFSQAGFPSAGSWMNYGLGSDNENLPGYVVLASGGSPLGGIGIYGNGFLPAVYQASLVDPSQGEPLNNITPREGSAIQRRRLKFIESMDRKLLGKFPREEQIESAIRNYETAFRMQTAVPDLMNLSQETQATKTFYGLDSPNKETAGYAHQCLLARRLVERGVRFIELTCLPRPAEIGQSGNPWDQHGGLKTGHAEMAMQVDQPIAALIKDLKARGLFEETLIVWAGEFGRTPFAQGSDGRDHNPFGFSVWLAGGGIKGGTIHGATDDLGYHAVENVATVYDLWATVLHLFGVDHEALTYRFGGRDYRLTDVHGNVIESILA